MLPAAPPAQYFPPTPKYPHSPPPHAIQEEDQLIADWEPEPLVPTEHPSDREVDPAPVVTGYVN